MAGNGNSSSNDSISNENSSSSSSSSAVIAGAAVEPLQQYDQLLTCSSAIQYLLTIKYCQTRPLPNRKTTCHNKTTCITKTIWQIVSLPITSLPYRVLAKQCPCHARLYQLTQICKYKPHFFIYKLFTFFYLQTHCLYLQTHCLLFTFFIYNVYIYKYRSQDKYKRQKGKN